MLRRRQSRDKAFSGVCDYVCVCLCVCLHNKLQEGWLSPTERASVSAISIRHILASLGYAPGTIAANVTWMEKGFNAGQTDSSIYPSIFNRIRASEILVGNCNFFSYPLHLTPRWGVPIGIPGKSLVLRKLESWGYEAVKTVWR